MQYCDRRLDFHAVMQFAMIRTYQYEKTGCTDLHQNLWGWSIDIQGTVLKIFEENWSSIFPVKIQEKFEEGADIKKYSKQNNHLELETLSLKLTTVTVIKARGESNLMYYV